MRFNPHPDTLPDTLPDPLPDTLQEFIIFAKSEEGIRCVEEGYITSRRDAVCGELVDYYTNPFAAVAAAAASLVELDSEELQEIIKADKFAVDSVYLEPFDWAAHQFESKNYYSAATSHTDCHKHTNLEYFLKFAYGDDTYI